MVGDWHSELHEEAICNAFEQLGHETYKFAWHECFSANSDTRPLTRLSSKIQNKFMIGPLVLRLNRDLIRFASRLQPDLIFIYRGTHIFGKTVRQIKQLCGNALVLGYNNDDPFSPQYPRWKWRHFLDSVPEYDLTLAYRKHNIAEYLAAGARRVELLRSWYVPERNYPAQLTDLEKSKYDCDVVFIGHYEDDGRLECLGKISRRGWSLKVFGPEWGRADLRGQGLDSLMPIEALRGGEYNKALGAAKIALCFLSKLNRDTYTRRCFEIPATKTFMLAEYTDDLASLYVAGHEADFFRSQDELMEKIDIYLKDNKLRSEIAENGYARAAHDGHDVVTRMRRVIQWVNDEKEQGQTKVDGQV